MTHGTAAAQEKSFPALVSKSDPPDDLVERPAWHLRAAQALGIIAMTQPTPKQWTFNPATVTLTLVLLSLICAGVYYIGQKDAEMKLFQERLKTVEDASKDKLKLEAYKAGLDDAHAKEKSDNQDKKDAKK